MKRHRLINVIASTLAISMALLTLLTLSTEPDTLAALIADVLLQMVGVIAAVAVLTGLVNLIAVHLDRFVRSEHGWPYSMIVLAVALAVIVLRILDRADIWTGDLEGEMISTRIFEAVQVSLESALAALLAFFLVYAAVRLMRREVTVWQGVFIAAVLVALVGWIPLDSLDALADAREWMLRVPVSAGARGILIGVGLGTVIVGVRVILGQDRSFRS